MQSFACASSAGRSGWTSSAHFGVGHGTAVQFVVRFEGGRATEVTASTGEETLRTFLNADDGGSRLGECALVDASGRIGPLDTVFYDTLLDENAASHLAFGYGFPEVVDEEVRDRVNKSTVHLDFMIGSPELTVTGITTDGARVPVLVNGGWQL